MKTGVISLTKEQHNRLDLLNKAIAGFVTVCEAAEKLGLTERHVQRLKKEVREKGPVALVHKNTNHKPWHTLSEKTKESILKIRAKPGYSKSNFRHFQELLATEHSIIISYSALYRLLKGAGVTPPRTKRRFKPHRRRKRRPQAGSLIQMDASPYDWLTNGANTDLHGSIDDATGQVTGLYLCKNECMIGYHEVVRRTVNVYGVPEAAYVDMHTIFRSPNADKAKAIDAPPGLTVNETQFGRAMSELGIQVIVARSPQAKGRIERLWATLQSRLPVELGIRGIKDIDTANEFLADYVFAYNSEFAVEPRDRDNAFLPLEEGVNLDHILCVKEERVLDRGQTFSYHGKRFQIEKSPYSDWIPPKAKIIVMSSPYIGIKVKYKSYVFETKPASIKVRSAQETKTTLAAEEPRSYRSDNAWEPKEGMLWQPGLPSYKEVFEVIYEIYSKPYASNKSVSR